MDVPTRWNSTYYMFSRLILLEEAVTVTVGLLHNPIAMLTAEEWTLLREICKILEPFEQITTEISSEKHVTISKIIPIHYGLVSVLKKFQTEITVSAAQTLILDLLDSISKRFGRIEFNPLLAKPTLLDPRFKAKAFSSADAVRCVKGAVQGDIVGLIHQQNDLVESSPTSTANAAQETCLENTKTSLIWQSFDALVENVSEVSPTATAIMEIRLYLEEGILGRSEDPLMWWKKRESLYPNLSNLAKRHLCAPSTSVPSERIFSKAGQIVSERRSRIKAKNVTKLLFLNCNRSFL
nr:unnamed protein product [Callosobruchus analis]